MENRETAQCRRDLFRFGPRGWHEDGVVLASLEHLDRNTGEKYAEVAEAAEKARRDAVKMNDSGPAGAGRLQQRLQLQEEARSSEDGESVTESIGGLEFCEREALRR